MLSADEHKVNGKTRMTTKHQVEWRITGRFMVCAVVLMDDFTEVVFPMGFV